jgi:hypothetical protein
MFQKMTNSDILKNFTSQSLSFYLQFIYSLIIYNSVTDIIMTFKQDQNLEYWALLLPLLASDLSSVIILGYLSHFICTSGLWDWINVAN